MLSFVDSLKQIIAEVQTTGGATLEHDVVDPILLQRLREHAVQSIAISKQIRGILVEWFIEGFFEKSVHACVVHLHKLGIMEDDLTYRIIAKVIDSQLSEKSYHWKPEAKGFEEELVLSLNIIWEEMGDQQTLAYTFTQDRLLIAWDYVKSKWKVTGLGRIFLELSAVQAVVFLLSIDNFFSTGESDFYHISSDVLRSILYRQRDANPHLIPIHRDILIKLGILRDTPYHKGEFDYDPNRVALTPIGKTVLSRVLNKDNPWRDLAPTIIQTEELGDTFGDSDVEIKEVLQLVEQTELADDANRRSISTSVELYHARKYLASLRVVFPSIEAIIANMLIRAGEIPNPTDGLKKKAQWLEQHGIIPPDVSSALEMLATVRNKILHGNFSPPEEEIFVFPLCRLVFPYLRRLLSEYHPASANSE